MQTVEELLKKLKAWIGVIEKALIGTVVIEAIMVILIGIASNKIDGQVNNWFWLMVSCSLVYILLLVIRTLYQLKFPGAIVEELTAKRDLEEKENLLLRQQTLNEFINSSITGLNTQTCFISGTGSDIHMCDSGLETGLKNLLQPIVDATNIIFDTSNTKKFTIGIHIDDYKKFPESYENLNFNLEEIPVESWKRISDAGILILKDELDVRKFLPKDLMYADTSGEYLQIQSSITYSRNNKTYYQHAFPCNSKPHTIVCSEIYEACSDETLGVMFIIYDGYINTPNDLPEVLAIFNRITANYLYKYDSCILEAIKRKIGNPPAIDTKPTNHQIGEQVDTSAR